MDRERERVCLGKREREMWVGKDREVESKDKKKKGHEHCTAEATTAQNTPHTTEDEQK